MVTGIILWFLFGVGSGIAVALALDKSRTMIPLVVLGIIGALVGGAFGQIVSRNNSGFSILALIVSVLSALALIGFYKNISPQS